MVVPNQTRLPIAFSPGQKRRAPVSLTTATGGRPARSAGVSAAPRQQRDAERPEIVGRHVVAADAGRVVGSEPADPGRKITVREQPVNGVQRFTAADSTPGTDCTRASRRSSVAGPSAGA